MIIDVHAHVVAPPELYLFRELIQGTHGSYGTRVSVGRAFDRRAQISEERLEEYAQIHLESIDEVGTDMQFVSGRPYSLMHSEKPGKIVHWWAEAVNNCIAGQVKLHPDRLRGVANLPQVAGESTSVCIPELERCVKDLGFVGILLNPDPGEGDEQTPTLGDEYWYPIYEKMVELDLPALIHSTACRNPRQPQSLHFIIEESIAVMSLVDSRVFEDFPNLKIIISHGGGAIPYQLGRWGAIYWEHRGVRGSFEENLRRLYFDTCLYTQDAIELLIKAVGPDRCLLGTENPGDGHVKDPVTGRWKDDLKTTIESIAWLSDADRRLIFEDNARRLYSRFQASVPV